MNLTDNRSLHIAYPDISVICPKCYNYGRLGCIDCRVEISSNVHLPDLDLHASALLTYPISGSQMLNNKCMIMCHCPECHTPMIAIDTDIIPYIEALNKDGFYTENSCSGHGDDDSAYIQFYYKAPDELVAAIIQRLDSLTNETSMPSFLRSAEDCNYKVVNDERLLIYMPLSCFEPIVNLITNPLTPGHEDFKKKNAEFGVKSLYDLIIIEQE